jgi:hypothetical protein
MRKYVANMKYFALLSFILCIAVQAYAQQQQQPDSQTLFYASKAEKYKRMKSTGTVLAIGGGVLFGIGIGILANSSIETTTDSYGYQSTTTTGHPGAGIGCLLLGAAGMGAGIPLWVIGAHNQEKYERRLATVTVGFNVNPKNTGLKLTYRF